MRNSAETSVLSCQNPDPISMKKNPEPTPIAIFGAKLILRHLDALTVEIEGVRQGQDIEYIHRMRVASRRLRNALPVFINSLPARKINAWGQPIRRITRSLGAARDLDVQLVSLQEFLNQIHTSSQLVPGIRRLILRLEQRRTKIQSRVLTTLAEFEASGTAEDMHTLLDPLAGLQDDQTPPAAELYDLAHSVISSRLVDFFSRSELIRDPANILDLHAQRIAAKHLRYTLELFAPLYPEELKPSLNACRKFQDQLGLIHDCDVWADYLPVFMEEEKQRTAWFYGRSDPFNLMVPGLLAFQADRAATRTRLYGEFIADWDAALTKGLWENLSRTTAAPLISRLIIYPPQPPSPGEPLSPPASEETP